MYASPALSYNHFHGTNSSHVLDPFSALDAHVGASVFKNVLLDSSPGKTRIIVTHALHFLPQVEYIYSLADGQIAEQGTYAELMSRNDGLFARYVHEFTSKNERDGKKQKTESTLAAQADQKAEVNETHDMEVKGEQFMQEEERNTGRAGWDVYKAFLKAGNGVLLVPVLVFALVISQATQVMSSYW